MMKLSQVCTIQTGFTARERLDPVEHGNVLVLQLRDVAPNGTIDFHNLTRIQLERVPQKYLVQSGDVVFRSRGESTTAAVIDSQFPLPALAVLPLIILRPDPQVLSGAYLAWVINQGPAQRHFAENSQGTSLRMVSRSSLDTLPLAVPSLEMQQSILRIDALAERERELAQQLTHARRELICRLLFEQAKGHNPTSTIERTTK